MHQPCEASQPCGLAQDVNPEELDRQIAEMYRDVASDVDRQLHFPTGRAVAEALGYPADLLDRLPAVDITPEQLAKSERLRRDAHVSFRHARIEELPFDDGSFDA